MIQFTEVTEDVQFANVAKLAHEILYEVYAPYIAQDHIAYFLEEFQSAQAIKIQIQEQKYHYFLISYNQQEVGYIGIQHQRNALLLSKLYLIKSYRGLKIGKASMTFVENFAQEHGYRAIHLVVNRQNDATIAFYQRGGFVITEPLVHHFPNGHSIEDYQMEKSLSAENR